MVFAEIHAGRRYRRFLSTNCQTKTMGLKAARIANARPAAEEGVQLNTDRFATLVAMAYEESAEHPGQAREGKIRQVVQLLK